MARQINSHSEVGDEFIAHQNVHGDLSSNNLNVAAGNSLISSGLKLGTIIFKDKYIVDMEKFTTGLSSKIFYRDALLLRGKEEKMKPTKYISTNSKEVEIINEIFSM